MAAHDAPVTGTAAPTSRTARTAAGDTADAVDMTDTYERLFGRGSASG